MTWRRVFELISWCGKGGVTVQLYTSIGCGCRNYCVINFVSHVEMVLIKIQSNNLNTVELTTWGRAGTREGGD